MPTPYSSSAAAGRGAGGQRRNSYHHGDLPAALLVQAWEVARAQGPEALGIRDLARRVGVSPTAAYRHVTSLDELVRQVAMAVQSAIAELMDDYRQRLGGDASGAQHLTAVGQAYIAFARQEPQLFRTAFTVPMDLSRAADPRAAGRSGLTPYRHLSDALDRMVTDGALPADLREGSEAPCWSAVHGFSMLVVGGPLRSAPTKMVDELAARTIHTAVRGVVLPPPE